MNRPTTPSAPSALALTLALPLLLAGCGTRSNNGEPSAAAPTETPAISIDESQLPPTMRFAADDLDPSKDPCVDFSGYVNARWLAANPIPPDRSSWGPGAMLAQRSRRRL
ncbi:MAG TPA: hypothetical protein VLA66_03155 [Thermoanaerobaculia bacterium]|nr:hypothetical protein [Thermoanaerobaculia bacterium]